MQELIDNCVKNDDLFKQAKCYMPGGVNSPARSFAGVGGVPPFIRSARGAYLYDEARRQYIDYIGAWGPMILGHNNTLVVQAVQDAMQQGFCFGAPCVPEIQLAQVICERVPSIEKVRMVNSGTEAVMAAIRLMRAATKRDKIIKFSGCYHGFSDAVLVDAGSGALTLGVPGSPGILASCAQNTLIADYNQLDTVTAWFEKYPDQIAGIIVEPIAGNMNMVLPKEEFLPGLRDICDHYGALLVFDEVMTGFRVGLQGAQGLYNVTPDLTTLGKIIGGGLPVGAYGGRADLMDLIAPSGPVYQAGTFAGNPMVMAAGLATLRQLNRDTYTNLQAKSEYLKQGFAQLAAEYDVPLSFSCVGGMFGFSFTASPLTCLLDAKGMDVDFYSRFFHYMLDKSVYFAPSAFEAGFMSMSHTTRDIDATLNAIGGALNELKD